MSKELQLLLPLIENCKAETHNGFTIYTGFIGENTVHAMQCGIGKVNAGVGTYIMVSQCAPDYIINTGVAGGGSKSVFVGNIVVSNRIAYHDVWCGPETTLGAVQGLPQYYTASAELLSHIPDEENIVKGLICSGDQFIDTTEQIERIKSIYSDVLAVDMESAAIAQVCHLCKVPFLSMRIISDSPGASKDNVKQYNNFWNEAPEQTFKVVKHLLEQIS